MNDFDDKGKFAKGNKYSFKNRPENANRNGRPKGRSMQDALRTMLEDEMTGEKLCDSLVRCAIEKALDGDFRFWQEIINRIDGKVPNRIADAEGTSLTFLLQEAVQSKTNGTSEQK
ncbi:MAG: hypothetical protein CL524_13110 [Aequorivita sp.]|nr:hypothetical protein [Aequorivita sp.]|tara:strand:+ start:4994 stop:5341 length:348 start_codon:yes stop_codon:yes gene_type:complete